MVNLIFQLWLKVIKVHVEDWILIQREATQLVIYFIAEHAHDEVEFYMEMVTGEQQIFRGLLEHLKDAFQSWKTMGKLMSDFYS